VSEARTSGSRSAAVVTVAIVLSRLVGLVRQRVAAHYLGTSAVADIVAASFRIGNLAQNLLGEGTLSATFIPGYARLRGSGREDDARAFAMRALGALLLAVGSVTLLGVLGARALTQALAAGFSGEKLSLTVEQVRLLFPMTGLLVVGAWALGVLNSHREFFLPYAAPVLWSVAQIAAILVAGSLHVGEAGLARALALGALLGAALVLVVLLRRARRFTGTLRPSFDFADPELREAVRRFPSVLLGRGVIQLSGLVDTLLVSFLGDSAVSAFNYAQTVYLLPMSILGTGEAAASLPEMAAEMGEGSRDARNARLRERLAASLERVTVLAIPAVVVLTLSGEALVAVLFRTGRFDRDSVERVAAAVAVYGLALLGNASGRLFATTFYALGDTRTPARLALVRVAVSTALALTLMGPLGMAGVVAGAVAAAWVEASLLGRSLASELDGLGLRALPWRRLVLLACATAAPALAARRLLAGRESTPLLALASLATTGLVYVAAAAGLRLVDPTRLVRRLRRR